MTATGMTADAHTPEPAFVLAGTKKEWDRIWQQHRREVKAQLQFPFFTVCACGKERCVIDIACTTCKKKFSTEERKWYLEYKHDLDHPNCSGRDHYYWDDDGYVKSRVCHSPLPKKICGTHHISIFRHCDEMHKDVLVKPLKSSISNANQLLAQMVEDMKSGHESYLFAKLKKIIADIDMKIIEHSCHGQRYLLSECLINFVKAVSRCSQDIQRQNQDFINEVIEFLCLFTIKGQINDALTWAIDAKADCLFSVLLSHGALALFHVNRINAHSIAHFLKTMADQNHVFNRCDFNGIHVRLMSRWLVLDRHLLDNPYDANDEPPLDSITREISVSLIELEHLMLMSEL